jgi:S-adenosylmethionine/arginine decarboxylase-like enzyme
MFIQHKQMLINAKVSNPIKNETDAINFLETLVKQIGMKIIKGPYAKYVENIGNKGLTAAVLIETSHIAFHIWDEQEPAMLQFDLYTCGQLDKEQVIKAIQERFDVVSMDWLLYDRAHGFVLEEKGLI